MIFRVVTGNLRHFKKKTGDNTNARHVMGELDRLYINTRHIRKITVNISTMHLKENCR